MANEYYEPGQARGARVSDLFGAIAARYDLINDVQSLGLHRWWKRRLVTLSGARPGVSALDLCCGTGDITMALEEKGAVVTGLDFSAPMLAVAATKFLGFRSRRGTHFRAPNLPRDAPPAAPARLVRGDAQTLPFADGQFDIVTVGYGLRNLASYERGLEEMCRVAKPGGRLLVLDFGKPPNAAWRWLYFSYLRFLVPLLGLVFCRNAAAYAYILESLRHYPAQEGVAAKMRSLGCRVVQVHSFLGGVMTINYGERP
jgi:demethylmenaquinone methyltransferase/2-methoxy-6-polyprenyl-1,4-benzoquinol methylase